MGRRWWTLLMAAQVAVAQDTAEPEGEATEPPSWEQALTPRVRGFAAPAVPAGEARVQWDEPPPFDVSGWNVSRPGGATVSWVAVDDLAVGSQASPEALPPVEMLTLRVAADRVVTARLERASHDVLGQTWIGRPVDDPAGWLIVAESAGGRHVRVFHHGESWHARADLAGMMVVERQPSGPSDEVGECGTASVLGEAEARALQAVGGPVAMAAAGGLVSPPEGDICGYSLLDEIDLLVVYSEGAEAEAGFNLYQDAVAHFLGWVEQTNLIYRRSATDARFRLVGVEHFDLGGVDACDQDLVRLEWMLTCMETPLYPPCAALSTNFLESNLRREHFDADLAVVVTDRAVNPSCTADDADPQHPLGAEPRGRAKALLGFEDLGSCVAGVRDGDWVVTTIEGGVNTFAHELGHALGAHHGEWQDDPGGSMGDNYGYADPDCHFSTLMATAGPNVPHACSPVDPSDVQFLSSDCVLAAQVSGGAQQLVLLPVGDEEHNNARIVDEAWRYVAGYRQGAGSQAWMSKLSWITSHDELDPLPVDGSGLWSETFHWLHQQPGQPSLYWVQVGTSLGATDCASGLTTGTSYTPPPPPGQSGLLPECRFVRLWTLVAGAGYGGADIWGFRDHRFFERGRVGALVPGTGGVALVGCDEFDGVSASGASPLLGQAPVPAEFMNSACDSICRREAVLASGVLDHYRVVCDLAQGSGGPAAGHLPWAQALTQREFWEAPNHLIYGAAENGRAFCCQYTEETEINVEVFELYGTSLDDDLQLAQCNDYAFTSMWGVELSALVRGEGGDDRIVGSVEQGGYSEELRGGQGTDILFGLGGDDVVHGGPDADLVHGGDGRDEVTGGGGADRVQGGPGEDLVDGGIGEDIVCDQGSSASWPDTLSGGDGDDFVFWDRKSSSGHATGDAGDGADVCSDYGAGGGWISKCETYYPASSFMWALLCPPWEVSPW
jgi:hypothetical protein